MHNINLLIFDECHNATKQHVYARIMDSFYDDCEENERPHILGLTASIINTKMKATDEEVIKQKLGRFCVVQNFLSDFKSY